MPERPVNLDARFWRHASMTLNFPNFPRQELASPLISHAERQVLVTVADGFIREVSEAWLEGVMLTALDLALAADEPGQVSLLIADDATVKELNRSYRGLDEVTDVLSFSSTHQGHWEGEVAAPVDPEPLLGIAEGESWPDFVLPPDELPPLGEVVISYPQTCRQAEGMGKPVGEELALLVIHGVLHLVGHDHAEPEETARMQALEKAALARIFEDGEDTP
ncbi:MAG: rRNA maturation RNase YbeY [Chloroflexi bacterium]|nr:rRNA maturation RNase YbeY [Chloroflexota bacterium]